MKPTIGDWVCVLDFSRDGPLVWSPTNRGFRPTTNPNACYPNTNSNANAFAK
jgi:hypothetical protein